MSSIINKFSKDRTIGKQLLTNKNKRLLKSNLILYCFLLPVIAYYILFKYVPIYGLIITFKNYNPFVGFVASPWTSQYGFHHFISFFESIYFWRLLRNTFLLSFYSLIFNFPLPIIFALFMVELKNDRYRSIVQSASYIPHFLSLTIVCGMMVTFLSTQTGIVNNILSNMGRDEIPFLQRPQYFRSLYVGSGIWQEVGWASIIYYSSLRSISVSLFEAADIDGAGRWRKMISISLPCILPTIITLLLLRLGKLMSVGFEKVFLLYEPITYEVSDVLNTYVYRSGFINQEYSFSSAVGLFNSVIRLILIVIFNTLSRRVSGESLW